MKKTFDNPMNLQLFALSDEEIEQKLMEMFGAEEEAQEEPQGEPVEAGNVPQEAQTEGIPQDEVQQEGTQPEQPQDPTQGTPEEGAPEEGTPQQPASENLLLGKFKTIDDLANAYQNLEAFTTQTRQELAQTKELANQLQSMVESTQGQQDMNTPPAEEEPEVDFFDDFYSRGQGAIEDIVTKKIESMIAPITQRFEMADRQEQWAANINAFAEQHPDLAEYQEAMADIMIQHPELKNHPNGLQITYEMAKGRTGMNTPSPDELLQDEGFLNEKILNNDQIRSKIIEDYLKGVQEGQPPATIGAQPAGEVPITPPNKPKSMDEAAEMAMSLFRKR